jgi:EAL domain-containing protein (putative c-di-GMP-specific phosphodiesterase class I)
MRCIGPARNFGMIAMVMTQTAARVRRFLERLAGEASEFDLSLSADGRVCGWFHRCQITSAFQPILTAEGEPVAAQALLRVHGQGGGDLAPWSVFSRAAHDEELAALDRRCRVVHALNFFAQDTAGLDLYLCVHERLIATAAYEHSRAFRQQLDQLGIPSERIVIELPAQAEGQEGLLCQAIASYRLNGFRVAINPTGVGQLEEVLGRNRPDAIKIDVRQLKAAFLRSPALHQATAGGAALVAKRVDTATEHHQAMRAGATHVQGHLFAAPAGTVLH